MDKLKQWVALTVLGCLAVMAGGWFLLVSPKRAEAAAVREQAASQESTNAGLRTQLEVLKAQAKDLPKKQADLARVAAKIPDNPSLPALIRALTAASTSAGVEFVSVTPGPPVAVAAPVAAAPVAGAAPADAAAAPAAPAAPTDPAAAAAGAAGPAGALAEIPVAINVVGGYFEVAQFIANLENLPRAMRVTNLTLAPGSSPTAGDKAGSTEDGRTLTSTITGSVFLAANRPAATPVVAPAT
ncbi:MAG: type 4a pilus biogenesis protein PilO [Mycobacteriales bacterium]